PHSLQHFLDRTFGVRELLCMMGAWHHIRVGPVLRPRLPDQTYSPSLRLNRESRLSRSERFLRALPLWCDLWDCGGPNTKPAQANMAEVSCLPPSAILRRSR